MSRRKKIVLITLLLCIPASALWVLHLKRRMVTLAGAVTTKSSDPRKQLPIAGVQVSAADGRLAVQSTSDASGLFKLRMRRLLLLGRRGITIRFRHPDYEPLNLYVPISGSITVAEMVPIARPPITDDNQPKQIVAHPVVRYSVKRAAEENVGSAVRSFEVVTPGTCPAMGRRCVPRTRNGRPRLAPFRSTPVRGTNFATRALHALPVRALLPRSTHQNWSIPPG